MKLTQLEVSLLSPAFPPPPPLPSPPLPSPPPSFPTTATSVLHHQPTYYTCTTHTHVPLPLCSLPSPGTRFSDGDGSSNEVQRTMLELINQLDGFDPRGNIKVLMATNRPDTLDPALLRPGRMDRKIEFGLPDLEVGP